MLSPEHCGSAALSYGILGCAAYATVLDLLRNCPTAPCNASTAIIRVSHIARMQCYDIEPATVLFAYSGPAWTLQQALSDAESGLKDRLSKVLRT